MSGELEVKDLEEQLAHATVSVDVDTEIVSFSGRGLKLDTAEDAQEVVKAIEECQSLKALKLEGNTVGVDAAKAIADALKSHSTFQRALWSDMFTGRLRSEIPPSLRDLGGAIIASGARLVELDLSDNAFGADGVNAIVELLKSESGYSLEVLRFNNNGLGIGGGKVLSKALLECHEKSTKAGRPLALKVFIAGRNRLENEGSTALAEAFKAIGTLEEISMPQNGIYHVGIAALCDAFSCNRKLRILNMNDNTFTEKGARELAKALSYMQALEVLNLGDCLLRGGGTSVLAEALTEGHLNLREVNLAYNEIDQTGGVAIAEAMVNKDKIEKLDLNGNCFGDEGIDLLTAIMEAVERLDVLASLSDDEGAPDTEDEEQEDDYSEEDVSDHDEEEIEEIPVRSYTSPLKREQSGEIQAEFCTVERFLKSPSAARLLGLGDDRAEKIVNHIGEKLDESDTVVSVFMKLSSTAGGTDPNVYQAVIDTTDALFSKAFHEQELDSLLFSNSLLVHLGLIKSEDKNFQPVVNLQGPLTVLQHVVKQPYFPKTSREILQTFLGRPSKTLDAFTKQRHSLIETLYQY